MTTEWTLTDSLEQTYIIDAIDYGDGEILFRRGSELEVQFAFNRNADGVEHTETYERLLKYNDYLTEDAVRVVRTSFGLPRYIENINPLSDVESYVFHMEPSEDLDLYDSWWVLLTGIEDESRLVGAAEQLSVTLVPLERDDGQTREEIVDKYEVNYE